MATGQGQHDREGGEDAMTYVRDCDHVISTGTLQGDTARVDYYTTTPAPEQWVAVGVMVDNSPKSYSTRPRLIVGNGVTEAASVADLKATFSRLTANQATATNTLTRSTPIETALPRSAQRQSEVENHTIDGTVSIHQ
ncbi:MAG: hypothetical protein WD401_07100 [Thermomicrobiaceae bacterium]